MMSNLSNSGSGQTTSSTDSSDGEDQEEPSSSNLDENVENVLASFREKWQNELRVSPFNKNSRSARTQSGGDQQEDFENHARALFQKGIELERAGDLYEAIQFYRSAVQIVPDIEFRLEPRKAKFGRERNTSEDGDTDDIDQEGTTSCEQSNEDGDDDVDDNALTDDDDQENDGELLTRIQRKLVNGSPLCLPKFDQRATHISKLPVEIILLILRWLVSSDLDLRSLEMFSMVCRGFYNCGRDSEIWRLVCVRVWGMNCGTSPGIYGNWRNMFIERARVQFHGCYISKTTYIRHGENNNDLFYPRWHLVAYYRYLRFFPEGLVLMLTSSEEPSHCVGQMRYRTSRNPVMSGYYRLKDDKITIVVQRHDNKVSPVFKKNKRKENLHENAEQTFHMELQIMSHHKKKHEKLVWTHYSVLTRSKRGDETTTNFDLVTNRYPPLRFSRVKSFTSESDSALQ